MLLHSRNPVFQSAEPLYTQLKHTLEYYYEHLGHSHSSPFFEADTKTNFLSKLSLRKKISTSPSSAAQLQATSAPCNLDLSNIPSLTQRPSVYIDDVFLAAKIKNSVQPSSQEDSGDRVRFLWIVGFYSARAMKMKWREWSHALGECRHFTIMACAKTWADGCLSKVRVKVVGKSNVVRWRGIMNTWHWWMSSSSYTCDDLDPLCYLIVDNYYCRVMIWI